MVLKLSAAGSVEGETLGQVRHPHAAEVLWAKRIGDGSAVCMLFGGAATLLDAVSAAFVNATEPPTARTVLDAIDAAGAGLPPPNDPVPPPLLRPGRSYADAIARIAARLAGALAHLHGRGVTHGDLKPSNVVLAPGGHPYLIDFNLSGAAGEGHRYGGTLPYMAPERVRRFLDKDVPAQDGPPADVYSFGAVVYEALSGRVPFALLDHADLKVIAADQLRRQLTGPPRLAMPGVPRGLARLVERCLAIDPTGRPTAAELERRLDRFVRRRVWRCRGRRGGVGGRPCGCGGRWGALRPSDHTATATVAPAPPPAGPVTAEEYIRRAGGTGLRATPMVRSTTFRRPTSSNRMGRLWL